MKLAVIDCETTGIGPDAELLELAVVVLEPPSIFRRAGSILVHPLGPIPPESSAIHHITASMLGDAFDRNAARDWCLDKVKNCDAVVAHNASFDRPQLPELNDLPWVCTMIIAKHIWPDAPNYGLQTLRYWRGLPAEDARGLPHRAIYDASCCAWLVADQLAEVRTLDRLIELTNKIPLLRTVQFGKHRGETFADAIRKDRRYFSEFVLLKSDLGRDPEIAHTVKFYLNGGN